MPGTVGALLGLVAFAFAGCRSQPPAPNVVLISIDCLNQRQLEDALARDTMPGVGAFAHTASVFTRAYANAPWTTPSHMTMLTGLYPSQHGRDISVNLLAKVQNFYERVPRFRTLADYLGERGAGTAAFVGKGSISAVYGLAQGFQTFEESPRQRDVPDFVQTLSRVREFLAHARAPFFLFVHTYDLHSPRPAGYASDDEALRAIDRDVSAVLEELRARGFYDDSVVVLTGDHGSNMIRTAGKCCSHGVGHYEENLRVPLVLKVPRDSVGRRSDRLVRHIDILPTVLELAGIPASDYVGLGESLLDTLAAGKASDRLSYSEADSACTLRRALVSERFKYIYTPRDDQQLLFQQYWRSNHRCPPVCFALPLEELFDLEADPFEERNLLPGELDGEQTQAVRRFRQEMSRHLNLPRAYAFKVLTDREESGAGGLPVPLRDALEALGYVQ
jgi:arylsulfatase A-like enzyme